MDLFTALVAEERRHPNFRAALDAAPGDREVLAEWANGFVDRDGKFVTEFQTTFNSSFWELYLFACLQELGHSVDFGHDAPDFVVTGPHVPFGVEATTANNAQGTSPEWAATPQGLMELEDRSSIVDEATIRLANAVTSKHQKYIARYARLPHVRGRPFVLRTAGSPSWPYRRSRARWSQRQRLWRRRVSISTSPGLRRWLWRLGTGVTPCRPTRLHEFRPGQAYVRSATLS